MQWTLKFNRTPRALLGASIDLLAVAGATAIPSRAAQFAASVPALSSPATPGQFAAGAARVETVQFRDGARFRSGRWAGHGGHAHRGGHGWRGGRWIGPAVVAGAIIGGSIAVSRTAYASRWEQCADTYRSFDWDDGTYQPYGGGPRELCPYLY